MQNIFVRPSVIFGKKYTLVERERERGRFLHTQILAANLRLRAKCPYLSCYGAKERKIHTKRWREKTLSYASETNEIMTESDRREADSF